MLLTVVIVAPMPLLLLAIAWVDVRTLTIPNWLTALLGALGFAFQLHTAPRWAWMYLLSAAAVLAGFWLLRSIHARVSGRIGLGLGDVKMAAACAIWLEPAHLPVFILVASGSALVYAAITSRRSFPTGVRIRYPFGPFLGLGLLVTFTANRLELLG